MARLAQFAIDDRLAREGVWLCYGADLWLRIARIGNPAYQERMAQLQEPLMRGRRDVKSIPTSMLRPLIDKAMSEHVLLDWCNYDADEDPISDERYNALREGPNGAIAIDPPQYRDLRLETLLDETGELVTKPFENPPPEVLARPWQRVVPYSSAEAERILRDRRYQPLRDFVFTAALQEETFRARDLEGDAGN